MCTSRPWFRGFPGTSAVLTPLSRSCLQCVMSCMVRAVLGKALLMEVVGDQFPAVSVW